VTPLALPTRFVAPAAAAGAGGVSESLELDVSQRLAAAHSDKLAALREAHEAQLKLQQQVRPLAPAGACSRAPCCHPAAACAPAPPEC
jgi:hypothetical protein